MTDYVRERLVDLKALLEANETSLKDYLQKELASTDKVLRRCVNDAETHRLQGKAQLLDDLITEMDTAFEEIGRLKLQSSKPDMSKAF